MNKNRTWTEFEIDKYIKNGEILDAAIKKGVKVYGMENANAYTFEPITDVPMRGMCPIFTAVNTMEDATELRQNGLTYPILVLDQPQIDEVSEYVKSLHRSFLAQSAESMEVVRALQARVMIYGGVLRLHLKVEMNSDGNGFHYFDENDSIEDLIAAMSLTGTYCEGIFTELSKDDPVDVNDNKIEVFTKLANKLEEATGKPFAIKHYFIK